MTYDEFKEKFILPCIAHHERTQNEMAADTAKLNDLVTRYYDARKVGNLAKMTSIAHEIDALCARLGIDTRPGKM